MPSSSQQALRGLTQAVWQAGGNDGQCPPEKFPTFRQLDDLITTTAWGSEAREEFFLLRIGHFGDKGSVPQPGGSDKLPAEGR